MRILFSCIAVLAMAGCAGGSGTPSAATPAPVPASWPQIFLGTVAGGFAQPVHVTHAGDGSDRIFVVEQAGRIRILDNGVALPSPFLDVSSRVAWCTGARRTLACKAFTSTGTSAAGGSGA